MHSSGIVTFDKHTKSMFAKWLRSHQTEKSSKASRRNLEKAWEGTKAKYLRLRLAKQKARIEELRNPPVKPGHIKIPTIER